MSLQAVSLANPSTQQSSLVNFIPSEEESTLTKLQKKIFHQDHSISVQQQTYHTIKFVAKHLLKDMVRCILLKLTESKNPKLEAEQNVCTHTAWAILCLIFNDEEVLDFLEKLIETQTHKITVPLTSENKGKDLWVLKIRKVVDSLSIYSPADPMKVINWFEEPKLNIHLGKSNERVKDAFVEAVKPRFNAIQHNVSQSVDEKIIAFRNIISELHPFWNDHVVDRLINKMHRNSALVDKRVSFIYVIALQSPSLEENKYTDDALYFQHLYLIEQSFSKNKKNPEESQAIYREYHSMIGQGDLNSFIETNYADGEEGTFNQNQMDQRLENLRYIYRKNPKTGEFVSFEKYFGYRGGNFPLFTFENDLLDGMRINFAASQFNSEETIDRLAALINSNAELKKIFSGIS